MRKYAVSTFLVFLTSLFSPIFGQIAPAAPTVADNSSLQDTNIKMRSAELERVKREADKPDSNSAINTKAQSKFPQIKEDYEALQIAEAAIVKTYRTDKKIDFKLIEISAGEIRKRARRLETNLFAEPVAKKTDETDAKSKEAIDDTRLLKDLIVGLNEAISNFISSPIFGNLKVVDTKVATKTREDLLIVQDFSERLSALAKKLK